MSVCARFGLWRVIVTGVAKQVRVAVYGDDHKKTGETATPTRITVTEAGQIVFE